MSGLAEAQAHNVPPDVFLKHYREIRDCQDRKEDAAAALLRAKKAAKASGVDMNALRLLDKLVKLDTDEAEIQIRHTRLYARWLELPLGSQLLLFAVDDDAGGPSAEAAGQYSDEEANRRGHAMGKEGGQRGANPNALASSQHVAWDKGWLKGNKIWLKGQQKIAGEMGPATGGRRRKAGNGDATAIN